MYIIKIHAHNGVSNENYTVEKNEAVLTIRASDEKIALAKAKTLINRKYYYVVKMTEEGV